MPPQHFHDEGDDVKVTGHVKDLSDLLTQLCRKRALLVKVDKTAHLCTSLSCITNDAGVVTRLMFETEAVGPILPGIHKAQKGPPL